MQVLGKMSDAVGKLGGAQVSYRLASVRQELQVDKEYAEFLQAEAEDLSLMTSGHNNYASDELYRGYGDGYGDGCGESSCSG